MLRDIIREWQHKLEPERKRKWYRKFKKIAKNRIQNRKNKIKCEQMSDNLDCH